MRCWLVCRGTAALGISAGQAPLRARRGSGASGSRYATTPIFPGDPKCRRQLWNCVNAHPRAPRCDQGSGYTLEQIQSLGTHTGTHISAPCHFHENKRCLSRLPEKFFGLRPLIVINVKPVILARHGNGDFFVTASYRRPCGAFSPGRALAALIRA